MPGTRTRLGDLGETAAAAYLARQGYDILARKWRSANGEIDLIARQGAMVVFIEVRTRRQNDPGLAAESVGARKRSRLIALAESFLNDSELPAETPWRIDVIAIAATPGGRILALDHIPYAVEAE